MVAHTCNPSTLEVEAGGVEVLGHVQLHTEFIASLKYMGCWKEGIRNKQTSASGSSRLHLLVCLLLCSLGPLALLNSREVKTTWASFYWVWHCRVRKQARRVCLLANLASRLKQPTYVASEGVCTNYSRSFMQEKVSVYACHCILLFVPATAMPLQGHQKVVPFWSSTFNSA